ncbi:MAG: lipid-A-disaccharide synthase [Parachlamydiaceae bacterium]|nr:lipid-A-disaccharide synthase [Parachlamydiaceae bacterium]
MIHEDINERIFIFAGEQSGDLHGSHLIKVLKDRNPTLLIEGVCGQHMRALDVHTFLNMEEFEVMGLTDVLLALPQLYKNFYKIKDQILKTAPDAVVLIDYPGFNLRLAKALRKHGYQGKIVQYVSPSVWAWGQHRIQSMENTLDLLMIIYPFESAYFEDTTLKTTYVGNPIQEYIRNYAYDDAWQHKLGIPSTTNLIALFPGSRASEIKRNFPILLETAQRLSKTQPSLQFAISCPNETTKDLLSLHLAATPTSFQNNVFQVPKQYTYELMRDSRTAIAKSGTVMLELALHHRPSIAIYKLTTLNRLYAKHILKLKLPYYCIVNILANHQVFPEFIEKDLTIDSLTQQLQVLHQEGLERTHCLEACVKLQHILGKHNASSIAAESILEILAC